MLKDVCKPSVGIDMSVMMVTAVRSNHGAARISTNILWVYPAHHIVGRPAWGERWPCLCTTCWREWQAGRRQLIQEDVFIGGESWRRAQLVVVVGV